MPRPRPATPLKNADVRAVASGMATDGSHHYGTPGGSARQEHERRSGNLARRVRERHPHTGGLRLALAEEPQHQKAWATGATGEEQTAAALLKRCGPGVHVLHDLHIPGSRANIDHIAIAPSGVWVIDSKRYKGKVEVRRPLLGKATLRVGGSDKTKLVEGLKRQVDLVGEVVERALPGTPVRGAFCFVEAELPMFGTPTIDGQLVLGRKGLAKRLNASGPVTEEDVTAVLTAVSARFPFA